MTSGEIRGSFLKYFERNGHRVVPSSSLVPHDDPSLLFTNAGMNQFKDVFLGKERREYQRAASTQKCMRVSGKHNDLDNVGPSQTHHTFFEMLGNFSFGDYFKEAAIEYAWQLLTAEWKVPESKLAATVFGGEGTIPRDEEAQQSWRRFLPADRIVELGISDNFWSMGDVGPCGRCSEIHYFRGSDIPCSEPVCKGPACSCGRYIEIWNNVFMEFNRQQDGRLTPLPAPSIDTGMGLERITAVLQGKISNYDTDVFSPLLAELGKLARVTYQGSMDPRDVSMRVVADHARAMTFLISDGVMPSNEWRGYVLRKLMRRAMRHGMRLGLDEPFLHRLVVPLARQMKSAYPELMTRPEAIAQVIHGEEERFDTVLTGGLPRLEEAIARVAAGSRQLSGEDAFRLYDTYGLPLDFIEDLAVERRVTIDRAGFERAMEGQRERARAKSGFEDKKTQEFSFGSDKTGTALQAAGDHFEGYTATVVKGVPILALFDEGRRQVPELRDGSSGYLALEKTPFYLESGGQVSDTGEIRTETGSGRAAVEGLTRISAGWPRLHRVRLLAGALRERDLVTAEIDPAVRDATRRNHTATHLLHAALRKVLGSHVKQAGSLVAPDRLRFDFVHHTALTRDEIAEIERLVNEQIYRNVPVVTEERSAQEAIAAGAMALFGEKYGDRVRVVSIPSFSMELCGGTHVRATGDIGFFVIITESGVAAGVRRVEALTGAAALASYQATRATMQQMLATLKVPLDQAPETVERLQMEHKRLKRELERLSLKTVLSDQAEEAETVAFDDFTMVLQRKAGLNREQLRALADALKSRYQSAVVEIGRAHV